MRIPTTLLLVLSFAACHTPEASVRPGINDVFLNADEAEIQEFVDRFEGESREIAANHPAIVAALDLKPGMVVADVGAGTGLFEPPFLQGVGPNGHVLAVEISPGMIQHLQQRAEQEGWSHFTVIEGSGTDCRLPQGAVDLVFVCDTYHHFEFPQTTLASIARGLAPGGRLAVVDFERLPGVSRPWVLNHVRIGKKETRAEIEQAGFTFLEEVHGLGLEENYMMIFASPE